MQLVCFQSISHRNCVCLPVEAFRRLYSFIFLYPHSPPPSSSAFLSLPSSPSKRIDMVMPKCDPNTPFMPRLGMGSGEHVYDHRSGGKPSSSTGGVRKSVRFQETDRLPREDLDLENHDGKRQVKMLETAVDTMRETIGKRREEQDGCCTGSSLELATLTIKCASELLRTACGEQAGHGNASGRLARMKLSTPAKGVETAKVTEVRELFTETAWKYVENGKHSGAGAFERRNKHVSNHAFARAESEKAIIHGEGKTLKYKCSTEHERRGTRSAAMVIGGEAGDEMVNFWEDNTHLKYYVEQRLFAGWRKQATIHGMETASAAWNMVAPGGVQLVRVESQEDAHFSVVFDTGDDDGTLAEAFFPAFYIAGSPKDNTVTIYEAAFHQPEILSNVLCHELGHVLGLRHSFALELEKVDEFGNNMQAGLYGKPDDQSVMSYNIPPHIDYYDVRDTRKLYEEFKHGGTGCLDIGNGVKHDFKVRRVAA